MPDFSHLISSLAIAFGLLAGVIVAVVLAILGHGWWSLLAIPTLPFALWVPAALLERN